MGEGEQPLLLLDTCVLSQDCLPAESVSPSNVLLD